MTKGYPLSRATRAWNLVGDSWPGFLDSMGGADVGAVTGDVGMLAAFGTYTRGAVKAVGGTGGYLELSRVDPRVVTPDDVTWFRRWATCRHVYRIDPIIASELGGMGLDERVPVEALRLMPYPIIYIDQRMPRPGRGVNEGPDEAMGCLAWLDRGTDGEELLYLHYIDPDLSRTRVGIELEDGMTIRDMVRRTQEVDKRAFSRRGYEAEVSDSESYEVFGALVGAAINMILFICSEEAGAETVYAPREGVRGSRIGRRTNTETVSLVGARIGHAIGEARRSGGSRVRETDAPSGTVTPHLRRAHWQHYWVGKRSGRTDGKFGDSLVLHWVAPVLVGGVGDAIETVHLG